MTSLWNEINNLSKQERIELSKELGISSKKQHIYRHLNSLHNHNYIPTSQLGSTGKDGNVFISIDPQGKQIALKKFHKKTMHRIMLEIKLQNLAAEHHISIPVKDFNIDQQFITMQILSSNLFHLLTRQHYTLTRKQKKDIQSLFKTLDEIGIFHGDPNPANFMYDQKGHLYLIDFGFASFITPTVEFKYGKTPNETFMWKGLLSYLKDLKKNRRIKE